MPTFSKPAKYPVNPLTKRIKRHIIGRTQEFFAITTPGLEPICLNELKTLPLSIHRPSAVPGGVEFKGRLQDCYLANLHLSTANRVLMRIGTLKASSFRQLEKKLSDIPWEVYLFREPLPRINITSRHSRLFHSDAIGERFRASIINRFNVPARRSLGPQPKLPPQVLFIRVVDDHFTISLDSSGELLHKRGTKKDVGRAPIRETLAAAILTLAGYEGQEPLLDPMCGSGTFPMEAAMRGQKIPPGWYRDFAFTGWPCFRPRLWAYIRKQAATQIARWPRPFIFASDNDSGTCKALSKRIDEFGFGNAVQVLQKNFFDVDPRTLTPNPGLVVINPPYGRRLGNRQTGEELFFQICQRLKQTYSGWRMALLAPHQRLGKMVPFETESYVVHHGGLKLTLFTAKIT